MCCKMSLTVFVRLCTTHHLDLHMNTAMKSEMEGNLSLFELTLPITLQTSSTIRLHLIHAGHLCFCKVGGLSTVHCEPVAFSLPSSHSICLLGWRETFKRWSFPQKEPCAVPLVSSSSRAAWSRQHTYLTNTTLPLPQTTVGTQAFATCITRTSWWTRGARRQQTRPLRISRSSACPARGIVYGRTVPIADTRVRHSSKNTKKLKHKKRTTFLPVRRDSSQQLLHRKKAGYSHGALATWPSTREERQASRLNNLVPK